MESQFGFHEQFRHAHDAVHRSPYLMAHVCQKLALGAGGFFGGHLGVIGLHLGAFLLGNIERTAPTALGFASSPMRGKKESW